MSLASPEDVWDAKLEDASLRLDEDATAAALAEEFGGDREFIDDLCSEAVTVAIGEGDNVVSMDYFARAAENIEAVPENDDTSEKRVAPHRNLIDEPESESDDDGESDSEPSGQVVASTTDTEEGTVEDTTEPEPEDRDDSETESQDAEPVTESDGEDEEPETVVADGTEYVPREEYDELEAEVQDLRGLVEALRTQVKNQTKVITGEELIGAIDPENAAFTDLMTRLQQLEDQTEENASRLQMVRTDGAAGADTPDGRARLIRQVLYNKAKSAAEKTDDQAGIAEMTRDDVDSRLDGGLHRGTLMDVMRRAADGHQADINGSSDLQPVESVTFHKSNSQGKQSKLVMDLSKASGSEIRQNLTPTDTRQNLTTGNTEKGA